jgi:hypothetical protein
MTTRKLGPILILIAVAGCLSARPAAWDPTNPFSTSYRGEREAPKQPYYLPVEGAVRWMSPQISPEAVHHQLLREGFTLFGFASARGNADTSWETKLREQAASVGAAVVLVYHGLEKTQPTDSATGCATNAATACVVEAFFYGRTRSALGIIAIETPDSIRQRLGTEYGVYVHERVDDSAAGRAGIVSGDVLLVMGGEVVQSVDQYRELLTKNAGKRVSLLLDRNGRTMVKQVEVALIR